jgi:DNA replication protein DnaC
MNPVETPLETDFAATLAEALDRIRAAGGMTDAELAAIEQARAEERRRRLVRESGLPPNAVAEFESSRRDRVPAEKTASAAKWGGCFEQARAKLWEPGALIGLVGGNGTGKTLLATGLGLMWAAEGRSVGYTRLLELQLRLEAAFQRGAKQGSETRADVLAELAGLGLLIVDECGRAGQAETQRNIVFELFEQRFVAGRPTVFVDDRNRDAVAIWMGPSLARRLCETGGFVLCDWTPFG